MKTVYFVTSAYPYYPGEQFIEEEINFWAAQNKAKIVLLPFQNNGMPRSVPRSVEVNLALAERGAQVDTIRAIIAAIVSPFLWAEIFDLIRLKKISSSILISLAKEAVRVKKVEWKLRRVVRSCATPPDVYTYWNGSQAYAAVLLKKRGLVAKVFSRAHRYDLYEYCSSLKYLPLKRQFIGSFDRVFSISEEGVQYIRETYGAGLSNLSVSRLGVAASEKMSEVSELGSLHLLSVSYCSPVKRLEKLIGALEFISRRNNDLKIKWVHIGDGSEFKSLVELARLSLTEGSVEWCFLGEKPNEQVRKFFEENAVDLFVNVSDSEGVPVTIMESMSYGVPAIAPRIGGVPELVSPDCGFLLNPDPSVLEIASAIKNMSSLCKSEEFRLRARARVLEFYNSRKNYSEIISLIVD